MCTGRRLGEGSVKISPWVSVVTSAQRQKHDKTKLGTCCCKILFPTTPALSLNFVLQSRSSMLTQMDEFFPPLSFISPMLNIIPIREVKIKIELHYNTAIGLLGIHPKHSILLEQFSHPCLLGLYLQHKGSGIKLNIHQRIWNE